LSREFVVLDLVPLCVWIFCYIHQVLFGIEMVGGIIGKVVQNTAYLGILFLNQQFLGPV
jgi:hypothetical protein